MGHHVLTGEQIINPDFIRGRNPSIVGKAKHAAKERGVDDALLERIGDYTGCAAIFDTGRPGPTIAFVLILIVSMYKKPIRQSTFQIKKDLTLLIKAICMLVAMMGTWLSASVSQNG